MKKIILIFLLCIFLFSVPAGASAMEESDTTDLIGNGEYAITQFEIDIIVNEDNTMFVTEHITAYFIAEKHGIFREIPLRNVVERLDGTTSRNRARISDITVTGDQYTIYNESGNRVINIGDPDRTQTGYMNYTISYLYDLGRDTGRGYDEFYFNLIGPEWDTTISNIGFTVTMPKDFDRGLLGFSSGPAGMTSSDNVIYEVNGNVITGRAIGALNAGEALTVRLQLPEGYFTYTGRGAGFVLILMFALPVIFTIIVFLLWHRYGRDNLVVETVEFYPPEGFNSAELGFLYKGKAGSLDVVSLLIYLANKGYIGITETEEKGFFKKKTGFTITKLKDYDGNNQGEAIFLGGLFKGATEVTSSDLTDSFYITLGEITKILNSKENREAIFEKNSLNKGWPAILMAIATFLLITVRPMLEFGDEEEMIGGLVFPGVGFFLIFASIFGVFSGSVSASGKQGRAIRGKIIGIIFGALFAGLPWLFLVLPVLVIEPVYMASYITGIACISLMVVINYYMKKRTAYGNEILGRIKGFINFLETAEKPRLEALVTETPSYFFDILPFTYVLGVSSKWISKFESISIQPPDWYSGAGTFSAPSFGTFMNSTMASAQTAMSSSPSSSGGSGGGSSGGGSGGGGGGSW